MKQEDKELLLKDLCARLPYGVKCYYEANGGKALVHTVTIGLFAELANRDDVICKPYLRPMSSMTKEEKTILTKYMGLDDYIGEEVFDDSFYIEDRGLVYNTEVVKYLDWLNSYHFDYRGLIEKGLALEAPEGMYQ